MNVKIFRKYVKQIQEFHNVVLVLKQSDLNVGDCRGDHYLFKVFNLTNDKIESIRIPLNDCEIISVDIE